VLFFFSLEHFKLSMQANVETLIEAARHLTPEDQERLVQALQQKDAQARQHRITEMRGLGKNLWQGIDAQEYVNAERDSWDN